jgi:ketosteroid isomerase-like protein
MPADTTVTISHRKAREVNSNTVGVVRRVIDACAAGDFEAVAALYHPEAEIVGGVLLGRGEEFTGGPAAVSAARERASERWEEYHSETEVVEEEGVSDRVLVRAFVSARSWGTPLVSEWVSWVVITVRDGLVFSVKVFRTEQEGRLAAGLAVAGERDL